MSDETINAQLIVLIGCVLFCVVLVALCISWAILIPAQQMTAVAFGGIGASVLIAAIRKLEL